MHLFNACPDGCAPYSGSVLLDVRRIAMRFGSKTHTQMSSRMTRLQGLRWIKGIAIRFSISPLPVENELDRPPQMSSGRQDISEKIRCRIYEIMYLGTKASSVLPTMRLTRGSDEPVRSHVGYRVDRTYSTNFLKLGAMTATNLIFWLQRMLSWSIWTTW